MSFINHLDGLYTATAYQKLNDFFVAHSPKASKRLYNCAVVIPVTFVAKIMRCVIEPLEQIASAAIHLAAVPFVNDRKDELLKVRDFILIELPCHALTDVLRIVFSPINVITDEVSAMSNPHDFETYRLRSEEMRAVLDGILSLKTVSLSDEDRIYVDKIYNKLITRNQISFKEHFTIPSLMIKYYEEVKKVHETARKKGYKKFRSNWEEAKKSAPMGSTIHANPSTSAKFILTLAKNHNVKVSDDCERIILSALSSHTEIHDAVDSFRRKLALILHPDKTVHLNKLTQSKFEEELKMMNAAWVIIDTAAKSVSS